MFKEFSQTGKYMRKMRSQQHGMDTISPRPRVYKEVSGF